MAPPVIYDLWRVDWRPQRPSIHGTATCGDLEEEIYMAWTKPALKEIACGMEINMYAPAEDEPVLF